MVSTEAFLIHAMKHQIKGCAVCQNQIEHIVQDADRSINIILKKINFPWLNFNVFCTKCQSNLSNGGYRCFACDDFILCDKCYEVSSHIHDHDFAFVSSK